MSIIFDVIAVILIIVGVFFLTIFGFVLNMISTTIDSFELKSKKKNEKSK